MVLKKKSSKSQNTQYFLSLPDAEVIVGDKRWWVMFMFVGENKSRDMTQDDHWTTNEEEHFLPHLPAVIGVGKQLAEPRKIIFMFLHFFTISER